MVIICRTSRVEEMFRLVTVILMAFAMEPVACRPNINYSDEPFWKILGGDVAAVGEFPFMLGIEIQGFSFCGASAIGDYWALTAAHCIEGMKGEMLALRAGSIFKGSNGTLHRGLETYPHPRFDSTFRFKDDDIGLIKVKDSFSTNKYVSYIGLPFQWEPVKEGTKATVIGWGYTQQNMLGPSSPVLKKVEVDVLTPKDCEYNLHLTGPLALTDNMFCAQQEGKSSYKGDSGGPLFVQEEDQVKQIGLVSWGDSSGTQAYPAIYTKVSHFRIWIFMKSNI
uniref:Peptidase S1 domain-containing protein n=1 Tax=Timema tahoe TaxID=61484 RepID=A0A7R9INL7_9NEOP|nr:unnamed protein product [Timema tahoe]